MSPKPDVSEERKNQILEAATNVFSEKGIHKARMDDVAEESGLSKGLLYWYFKSKDEIIIAIAERLFKPELDLVQNLAEKEGSATDLLNEFLEIMLSEVDRVQPVLPLLYEFFAMIVRKKAAQEIVSKLMHHLFAGLEIIIQRGIDQGEFRPVNPQDTVIAIGAMFEGTYLLWAYDSTLIDIKKHMRAGFQLLLAGLVIK